MRDATIDMKLLRAAVDALPADNLSPMRRAAAARFADMGFPTTRDEHWKYTSLAAAAQISNEWLASGVGAPAVEPAAGADARIAAVIEAIDARWLVVRDGLVDDRFFGAPGLEGVELSRLTDDAAVLVDHRSPMAVFNAALLRDGLLIKAVGDAAAGGPIGILYLDSPSSAVVQTRLEIEVAAGATLSIIECSMSADPGRQFTNAVVGASLERGAHLDHVRIQNRDSLHVSVNRMDVRLGQDAIFQHNGFDLGGALTRNDVAAEIAGAGASVVLNGLYLASGQQHIDNHTSVVHAVGPATSVEEYRGILAGGSRCVFNGKVTVAKGADGTDARQANHNLLLSKKAEIDTKPELEIYADDVKCAHGATVGQLDESALFYLRSRGLDADQAQQILTRAFAASALSVLAIDACHDYLSKLLDQRLQTLVGEKP